VLLPSSASLLYSAAREQQANLRDRRNPHSRPGGSSLLPLRTRVCPMSACGATSRRGRPELGVEQHQGAAAQEPVSPQSHDAFPWVSASARGRRRIPGDTVAHSSAGVSNWLGQVRFGQAEQSAGLDHRGGSGSGIQWVGRIAKLQNQLLLCSDHCPTPL